LIGLRAVEDAKTREHDQGQHETSDQNEENRTPGSTLSCLVGPEFSHVRLLSKGLRRYPRPVVGSTAATAK
jgi:hypothetical protein